MLDSATTSQTGESNGWAERSAYWLDCVRKHTPKRKLRERRASPFILAGQGISLRVDKGALLVRDGLSHFPQERAVHRFFPGDMSLPKRFVVVDGSGDVTLDAIDWLAEQGVTLVRLKWDGTPVSVIGTDGVLFDRNMVNWQVATRADEAARLAFAVPLIQAKADASLHTLDHLFPPFHSKMRALRVIQETVQELHRKPPDTINELLRIEGRIAAIYFNSWRSLEMKWKGLKRHPVPKEWQSFRARTSMRETVTLSNRNATHPINAMLNYAYGLTESHVRVGVLADGYDPVEGILHSRATRDRHSFVFDLMEPLRPVVDRAIIALVLDETFSAMDFVVQSDGVCRLNPEVARRVVQVVQTELARECG